jgi:hypothetical protein
VGEIEIGLDDFGRNDPETSAGALPNAPDFRNSPPSIYPPSLATGFEFVADFFGLQRQGELPDRRG